MPRLEKKLPHKYTFAVNAEQYDKCKALGAVLMRQLIDSLSWDDLNKLNQNKKIEINL